MSTIPHGTNSVWTVQSAVTVGSSAGQTNVTTANVLTIYLGAEIYINFGSSSTAASSSANDIILGAGLHSLVVRHKCPVLKLLSCRWRRCHYAISL